jgi:acetyl-CoA acetyltransferase
MNLLDRVRVAALATFEEAQFTFREMKDTDFPPLRRMVVEQRRRLTITISETSARVRPVIGEVAHEVTVVASSIYQDANAALQVINEARIRPFREALGEEWRDCGYHRVGGQYGGYFARL